MVNKNFLKYVMVMFLFFFLLHHYACAPDKNQIISNINEENRSKMPEEIELLTWNIGYSALGENADFIADGGKSIIPSDKNEIIDNYLNIAIQLNKIDADIIFFQEMAGKSVLTRNIDIFDTFHKLLPQYNYLYFSPRYYDYSFIFNINIGNSIFSKIKFTEISRLDLGSIKQHPLGPKEFQHFLKVTIQVSSEQTLIIYLVHLSAFDKNAGIRFAHLDQLKEDMLYENNRGNFIICAGDWNLRIIDTKFVHTTPEKYLIWLYDLPESFTPAGWKWIVDPSVPTFRTLERSYLFNENYTAIIDGILTSPGIIVHSYRVFDFGFKNSDHNPIYMKFSCAE